MVSFIIIPLRTREDASILTSALVWTYVLYLQWAALSSNDVCNPQSSKVGVTIAKEVCGIFFTFIALFTISAMSKKNGGAEQEGVAIAANEHLIV